VRARLLGSAGLAFAVEPAAVDEAAIKERCRAAGRGAVDCARALAEAKAQAVSLRHPSALVIGADQMLVCDREWFDKPEDFPALRRQLEKLRGRVHVLETAACAVRRGARLWSALSAPRLRMHDFTDSFLDDYLSAEGVAVLGSLGGYRLEGRGVQLFEEVDGDYFSVLGLPLIELLGFLRRCGWST
jgi:septum formation protein